jgi:hypothetical protein
MMSKFFNLANGTAINAGMGNRSQIIKSGTAPVPPSGSAFIFTYDGGAVPTLQLGLVEFNTYNFTVDYGDGSPVETITSYNQAEATHIYAVPNVYNVTITGTCERLLFMDGGVSVNAVLTVEQWGDIGITDAYQAFQHCTNLTSVASNFWPNVTSVQNLFFGTSLASIPTGFFSSNSSGIVDLTQSFAEITELTSLPIDLFDELVNLANCTGTFSNCGLTSIPENLFLNNPLTTLNSCFTGCPITEVPAGLLAGQTILQDVNNTFEYCQLLTTVYQLLFDSTSSCTSFDSTFKETSISVIPDFFFASCNAAISFNSTFADCPNITYVHDSIWGSKANITSFSNCFANCTGITGISSSVFNGIYTTNPDFSGCFYNCNSLTSIDAGLFSTVVSSNFALTFNDCTSLTDITDGGSWVMTNVTDATDMFNNVTLSTASYNNMLIGWAAQFLTGGGISFSGGNSQFSMEAFTARNDLLITNYFWGISDGGQVSSDAFNFTYDSFLGGDLILPLPNTGTYNFVVDFGDGNIETITAYNQAEATHTYAVTGVYNVSILGKCTSWQFAISASNVGVSSVTQFGNLLIDTCTGAFSGCNTLVTITAPFWPSVIECQDIFFGCSNLSEIPVGFFSNSDNTITTIQNAWYDCSSLSVIPESLFVENSYSLTYLNAAFKNTAIVTVEDGLFAGCSSVWSAYSLFENCTSLTTVESGAFADMTGLDDITSLFAGCSSLNNLPAGLFSTNTVITQAPYVFADCTQLTTGLDNLFSSSTGIQYFNNVFANCTSLAEIPDTVFGTNSSASSFNDAFNGCSSLSTIYGTMFSGLGASNISFNSAFYACSLLTDLPSALFDGVSVGSLNSTFSNSGVINVADGGNWNITALTDASSCFDGCTININDYTMLIHGWAIQAVQYGVSFSGGNSTYWEVATPFRDQTLIVENGWSITDGGVNATPALNLTMRTTTNPETLTLPLQLGFNYDFFVHWGDGVVEHITGDTATHEYYIASDWQISIVGQTISYFDFSGGVSKDSLISIDQWGGSVDNIVSMSFATCINLTDVNDDNFYSYFDDTYIQQFFAGCVALDNVPATLFDNLGTNITSPFCVFLDCYSLPSIDPLMFSVNTAITEFIGTWSGCTSITTIPTGFFDTFTGLVDVGSCFENCSGLTAIPATLFATNSSLTYASASFKNCTSLTAIPSGLFASNSMVSFFQTFQGCSSLVDCPDADAWDITALTDGTEMFDGVTLNTTDYSNLLVGWEAQAPLTGVTFNGGNSLYDTAGDGARASLTDTGTYAWVITDGGPA